MDREAWHAAVHGVTSRLTRMKQLSTVCYRFETDIIEKMTHTSTKQNVRVRIKSRSVQGLIATLKDIHSLTPGNCKRLTLPGRRDFAGLLKDHEMLK